MQVPARLNGYPVIHSKALGDDSFAVIVFREGQQPHPFVVATWYPILQDTWAHGDYVGSLLGALDAFARRTK